MLYHRWVLTDRYIISYIPVYYRRIENAEGYVLIAVYLFIYLYACYSHYSKSIKPNRIQIWWDDWLLSGDHLIIFWD